MPQFKDKPITAELKQLLDWARSHEMTPAEIYEQRISFAYGNLSVDSPLTKDDVRREAERLYGPAPK
jgi:hypothetical protein